VKILSKKIIEYSPHLWVILIWVVIFSLPMIIVNDSDELEWNRVLIVWNQLLPFFVLFLINHYLLVPFFFFKKKRLLYFGLIVVFVGILVLWTSNKEKLGKRPPKLEFSHEQNHRLPPPDREDKRTFGHPNPDRPPNPQGMLPPFVNTIFISILVLGFDIGLIVSLRWSETEKNNAKLEKESVKNQLAFLKQQISPHFFMNTLNNIHALVDINTDEAKEAIIKLSRLMRYLLYESDSANVPLAKEIEFIQSYVNLMKLRFSDKVVITLNIADNLPLKDIPPMLFTSLIENAFKHGISYKNESEIKISMYSVENRLLFEITNKKVRTGESNENSGIGLDNTKKQLELIYGNSYNLDINDNIDTFNVNLSIPI